MSEELVRPMGRRERWWHRYWSGRTHGDWPETEGGSDSPDARVLYRRQAGIIRLLLDGHRVARVLEVGCGDGTLYDALQLDAGTEYWGVDYSTTLLDAFRARHPELHLLTADVTTFRAEARFDLVLSVGFLQYLDDRALRAHLRNAAAMLGESGVILHADFTWRSHYWFELGGLLRDLVAPRSGLSFRVRWHYVMLLLATHARSREQLARIASEAGLEAEFFGSLIQPGWLTMRCTRAR